MAKANTNAKEELLRFLKGKPPIQYMQISRLNDALDRTPVYTGASLDDALKALDGLMYNSGYGTQQLFGTIWFADGTWAARAEYDGSEWWKFYKCPTLPIA